MGGRGGGVGKELILRGGSGQWLSRLNHDSCYTGHGVWRGAAAAVRRELRHSVTRGRQRREDQRLPDYVLLTRNKSSWIGRLKDHLESMSDYRGERADGRGGKRRGVAPRGGWRDLPAKTALKPLRQTL